MNPDLEKSSRTFPFHVIAERRLAAKIQGKLVEVKVTIGQPKPHPQGDWCCPFQILGIGDARIHEIGGVDAVQALQLVMVAIGSNLQMLQRDYELTFLDEDCLGFPVNTMEATGSCPYCRSGGSK